MYDIIKNIPIPEKKKNISERALFLMSLEIGDSFDCTRQQYMVLKSYERISKTKLTCRMLHKHEDYLYNNSMDTVRVWRIE